MEHAYSSLDASTPKRRTPWHTLSARVISVVSRKGGVGKTTSAVNLGAAFALSGHTVLIIGMDPQCGVTRTLGSCPEDLDGGLLDLWEHDVKLTDLAQTSPLKDLFFASSRVRNLKEEERYESLMETKADTFVQQVDRARNLYDTILIDCPPHLGGVTQAALRASDSVLVPVQAEELCRDSLGSLLGALDSLNEARGGEILEGPEIEGIFLTMLNQRTRMGRHVAAKVAEEFGPVLLENSVPRTTRLSEMALRGKPSVIYDRRSTGSRAYFNLADEILRRYNEREGLSLPESNALDVENATTSIDSRDLEPLQARRVEPESVESSAARSTISCGLDRLLGDLRAHGSLELPSAPMPSDPAGPEMVSLDDLLAEEESESGCTWDEPWTAGGGTNDRLN